jgi:hypothetical protein
MPKPEIFITFRVTEDEKELLKQYCDQEGRTQTDILRELIRGLRRRLKPLPIHEAAMSERASDISAAVPTP